MSETKTLSDKLLRRTKYLRRTKEIYQAIRTFPDESVDLWLDVVTAPAEQTFVQYRSEVFTHGNLYPEYFPTLVEQGIDPQMILFDLYDTQQEELLRVDDTDAVLNATKNELDYIFGEALKELQSDWQRHYFLPVCDTFNKNGERVLVYNASANVQFTGRLMQTSMPGMVGRVVVPEMIVSATPEPLPGEENVVCLQLPDLKHPDPKLVAQHIAAAEMARENLHDNPHVPAAIRRRQLSQDSVAIPRVDA